DDAFERHLLAHFPERNEHRGRMPERVLEKAARKLVGEESAERGLARAEIAEEEQQRGALLSHPLREMSHRRHRFVAPFELERRTDESLRVAVPPLRHMALIFLHNRVNDRVELHEFPQQIAIEDAGDAE